MNAQMLSIFVISLTLGACSSGSSSGHDGSDADVGDGEDFTNDNTVFDPQSTIWPTGNWFCREPGPLCTDLDAGEPITCGYCSPCQSGYCVGPGTCSASDYAIQILSVEVQGSAPCSDESCLYLSVLPVRWHPEDSLQIRADIIADDPAQESLKVELFDSTGAKYGDFDLIGGAWHFDLSWARMIQIHPVTRAHELGVLRMFRIVATGTDGTTASRDVETLLDCEKWWQAIQNDQCQDRMRHAENSEAEAFGVVRDPMNPGMPTFIWSSIPGENPKSGTIAVEDWLGTFMLEGSAMDPDHTGRTALFDNITTDSAGLWDFAAMKFVDSEGWVWTRRYNGGSWEPLRELNPSCTLEHAGLQASDDGRAFFLVQGYSSNHRTVLYELGGDITKELYVLDVGYQGVAFARSNQSLATLDNEQFFWLQIRSGVLELVKYSIAGGPTYIPLVGLRSSLPEQWYALLPNFQKQKIELVVITESDAGSLAYAAFTPDITTSPVFEFQCDFYASATHSPRLHIFSADPQEATHLIFHATRTSIMSESVTGVHLVHLADGSWETIDRFAVNQHYMGDLGQEEPAVVRGSLDFWRQNNGEFQYYWVQKGPLFEGASTIVSHPTVALPLD